MTGPALVATLCALSCLLAGAAFGSRRRGLLLDRAGRHSRAGRGGIRNLLRARGRLVGWTIAVAGIGLGSILAGAPGAIAGLGAALAVPAMVRRRRAARRDEQIEAQLAEAVASMGAGLRAGLSLSQAIRFAAEEGAPPLGPALCDVVDRAALGIPLGESLDRWAESEAGPDVRLAVAVLQLHHRTGGDLPAVLDQLARTLRERRAASREVRALTAQARLSGAILGLLPVGFFLFLSATSRQNVAAAYHSPTGQTAIAVGLVLQAGAFLWIRRLLRVSA